MNAQSNAVEFSLQVDRELFVRLAHLADAIGSRNQFLRPDCGVPALVLSLLDSLDAAICRPGSHEYGCFSQLFGSALDVAADECRTDGGGEQPGDQPGSGTNQDHEDSREPWKVSEAMVMP